MAEVFTLSRPIMVDGKEVNELPYDFDSMTAKDKLAASKKMKLDGIPSNMEELDPDYHLYLFAEAVCKADKAIETADVLRISAKDARRAGAIARDFFYYSSEE